MIFTRKHYFGQKTVGVLYLIDSLEGDGAERQLCELVKGVQGIPVITSSIRNGMNLDWREAIRTWYQSHFGDSVAKILQGTMAFSYVNL